MNRYKIHKWLAKPWIPGLTLFVLTAPICLYTVQTLSERESLRALLPAGIALLVLFMAGIILLLYNSRMPANSKRKKTESELLRSRDSLRELANYIENIREEERATVARKIHDELGQMLTVLKMDISQIGQEVNIIENSLTPGIKELLETLDKMIETVRKISADLRPGMLDDIGLCATLEWYCGEFTQRTGIKTAFISGITDEHLPPKMSINIFRIFEESLATVVQSSCATKTDVSLRYSGKQLTILIQADGKALNLYHAGQQDKPEIRIMKERARLLNGTYNISAQPDQGPIVELTIPVDL